MKTEGCPSSKSVLWLASLGVSWRAGCHGKGARGRMRLRPSERFPDGDIDHRYILRDRDADRLTIYVKGRPDGHYQCLPGHGKPPPRVSLHSALIRLNQFVMRRPTISASSVRLTSTLSPSSPLPYAHISLDPEDQPVDGILDWRREPMRQVVFELASMHGRQRQSEQCRAG